MTSSCKRNRTPRLTSPPIPTFATCRGAKSSLKVVHPAIRKSPTKTTAPWLIGRWDQKYLSVLRHPAKDPYNANTRPVPLAFRVWGRPTMAKLSRDRNYGSVANRTGAIILPIQLPSLRPLRRGRVQNLKARFALRHQIRSSPGNKRPCASNSYADRAQKIRPHKSSPIEQRCKALKALCHCMVAEFAKVSKAECGTGKSIRPVGA